MEGATPLWLVQEAMALEELVMQDMPLVVMI
jgi:hypothetical protein